MRAGGQLSSALATVSVIALAIAGCASLEQRLQRFQGRPIADLVADHGPANRIVPYPYGGTLYIWETESRVVQPQDATSRRSRGLGGQPMTTHVRREIALVDEGGVIVRISVEHSAAPRTAVSSS